MTTVDLFQFKRGTQAGLAALNPPLAAGEEIKEIDTGRTKIGPQPSGGSWNDLPYEDEGVLALVADDVAIPESAISVALKAALVPRPDGGANGQALIRSGTDVVWGDVASEALVIVYHSTDASYPRPVGASTVMWVGTVNPLNRIAGDIVALADPAPLPDVELWGDDFTTDGALGNTERGGKAWSVVGTGYTAARVGGKLKFTAASSSVGLALVDSGTPEGLYEGVVSTKGTNNQCGIAFRVASLTDHLVLSRVSAGDSHYCLKKRVGSTYTVIQNLTPSWADGDAWAITCAGTTITISINGVQAYTGTITEHATATKFGVYCGASGSFAEMAYDTLKFTGPA